MGLKGGESLFELLQKDGEKLFVEFFLVFGFATQRGIGFRRRTGRVLGGGVSVEGAGFNCLETLDQIREDGLFGLR